MQNRTEQLGILYGLLGVILFSFTLPMTKIALPSFSAYFIAIGRAFLASLLAGFILWLRREPFPSKSQLKSLVIIAFGVIFGFPILSALAMNYVPASHGAIVLALLPLATAGMAVVRAGERPSILFWISSIVGCATVLIYSFQSGVGDFHLGDFLLLGAVMSAALGYAEGGALSLEMPGWKVISWALVISSPFLLILMIWQWDPAMLQAPIKAWMSFFYLALFSQYLGFFPWYSGLAMGGVAKVSQLQYLQPFFTILFSVFLLGENITLLTIVIALIVVFTVIIGKNAEVKKKERNSSAVSSEKG